MFGAPLVAPLPTALATFLLLLARVGGVVVAAPIIGDAQVPAIVKAGFSAVISFVLLSAQVIPPTPLPADGVLFVLAIVEQLVVGLALGFVSRLIFDAIEMAGALLSAQMGLSMASIVNPMFQQASTVFGQLHNVLAALIFLSINGPEWIAMAMDRSFALLPITGGLTVFGNNGLFSASVSLFTNVLVIGSQISLPVLVALTLCDLSLGLVNRMVSSFNVFAIGMPLKVLMGLIFFLLALPTTVTYLGHAFQTTLGEALLIWKGA